MIDDENKIQLKNKSTKYTRVVCLYKSLLMNLNPDLSENT